MTHLQQNKIAILKEEFVERCSAYSGLSNDEDCSFGVYINENNIDDKNVTIQSSFVSGISDDYQPFYEIVNLLVQENGDTISLSSVLSDNEKMEYLKGLTKINL